MLETFGVSIPDTQVCPNHSTPFRAFADAYFARSAVSVWKASRGLGGKTFLLALLGLTEALTLHADVNVLGGSGEQSQRAKEHMSRFMEKSEAREYLVGDVSREMRFTWGNQLQALMASQRSVRGPHPQRLLMDEVDEIPLPILDAAMGQPMSKGAVLSQVVQSSTHQYANGTMTKCLARAAESGYQVHEWCLKETLEPHGWLSQAEAERKRAQMSKAAWENEVELQEPSPESRAIQPEAVARLFDRTWGEVPGEANKTYIFEAPEQGARYSTGADWARKQDWTVIVTWRIDVAPMRVVAFERAGREDWPVMVAKFDARIRMYGGASANDGTGIGDVINGFMTVPSESVQLRGRPRAELLTRYIVAVENGEVVSPFIGYMESEHRFASRDDVYNSSDDNHLPDTICAMAMAYRAALTGLTIPSDADVRKWGGQPEPEASEVPVEVPAPPVVRGTRPHAMALDDDIAAWGAVKDS